MDTVYDSPVTAARSALMARVRGKNTRPELIVRRTLHAMGERFRLHRADYPGRPDIVLPRHRLAIFVHGCFWHRHPGCRLSSMPKTRVDFWKDKFATNVARDARNVAALQAMGWRVATVWECETRNPELLAVALEQLVGSGSKRRPPRMPSPSEEIGR
ncbi:very short patch repair endonuclease [Falsiroseomonas sp. HC035]|uniref:very short patch repair endonuclease n=1 Tax=Falsiroseomonas sp. HC035 TaxID=3390999 RepID=UPI003D31150A